MTADIAPNLAREYVRRSMSADLSLADIPGTGVKPIVVSSACLADGRPLVCLAKNSEHADLLSNEPRITLLYDSANLADGGTSVRGVTLIGNVEPSNDEMIIARFLRRHPDVGSEKSSNEFLFLTLDIKSGSLLKQSGERIEIDPAHFVLDVTEGEQEVERAEGKNLRLNEKEALDHMNNDHPEIAEGLATRLLQQPGGGWQFTGLDPEGCDLRKEDDQERLAFPRLVLEFATLKLCMKEFLSQPESNS